ncbi:hypothetical protein JG688_00013876 [Phytophthora aleatoria]|uniref:RxLR effector protein n=1 Tax=Phytophthora aleatoria TaxID=2496075 RepID=A0A8J5MDQ8_9STRA|nr:hypothetical protein JG688_00013876 [Phytophthora aleatoria]
MRLAQLVLTVVIGLIVTVNSAATTTAVHEIDTSIENMYASHRRRELDERSTELVERGKRGGGGAKVQRTRTHTSIVLMYPNAIPHGGGNAVQSVAQAGIRQEGEEDSRHRDDNFSWQKVLRWSV